MKPEASTPEARDIFNSAHHALNNGRKKAQEVLAEIEALQQKHSAILADNAGLEAMVNAATEAVSKAKGQKATAAKKVAAKAAAPKPAAKKAAKKAAAKKVAAKAAAPKAEAPVAKKAAKKAAKAAAKKAPAAKKAAKKAPAAKSTTSTEANTSNAAEGRRAVARGDRPPMKEAMATVMGKSKMGASEVVEGLKAKGWMPNAEDPQQYVSYMLSSNKDVFERLERGVYKVRDGVVFSKKTKAAKGKGDTAAAKKPAAAAAAGKKSNDEELADLGIKGGANVASNPFA